MPNKWNKYVLFPAKVQNGQANVTAEALVWAESAQMKNHVGGTKLHQNNNIKMESQVWISLLGSQIWFWGFGCLYCLETCRNCVILPNLMFLNVWQPRLLLLLVKSTGVSWSQFSPSGVEERQSLGHWLLKIPRWSWAAKADIAANGSSVQSKTLNEQPVFPTQHLKTGSKQLTEASIRLVAKPPPECRSYVLFFFLPQRAEKGITVFC